MKTKTNGLVIATALVPTLGHKYLIDFASNFANSVTVIISTRSFEPKITLDRIKAFKENYKKNKNVIFIEHSDDNAPQNDDGTEDFWDYLVNTVKTLTNNQRFDYIFSSEIYGNVFAEKLGIKHIPVDVSREIFDIKGTQIRKEILTYQDYVLPEFLKTLKKKIVITGPESCGKTTMTRWLSGYLNGTFIHEWARPYLENTSSVLTDEAMLNIVTGQSSIQKTLESSKTIFNVMDTDLTATEMYYEIGGFRKPKILLDNIKKLCKDNFYIVMNDQIPFEPDPLRYGGDKRESSVQQWIQYYETMKADFYVVKETAPVKQRKEILAAIYDKFDDLVEIENFNRER